MPGINDTTYPFDPTGTQSSNKITGEQHIITPVNYKDYSFIVPNLAPFFANSLVMTFVDTDNNTVTLAEGVDYYLSHWFISASRACAKPIYGSISILNRTLTGVLTITYQTLGGDWTLDETQIANILADNLHNPRITSWDSVSEMPYNFPVVDHPWDLVDLVGMSEVVTSIDGIRDALLATGGDDGSGLQAHILNYNNPHHVTADQVNAYSKPDADFIFLRQDGTAANALKFNGMDLAALETEIMGGTAFNSSHLEGKSLAEIEADLGGGSGNATTFDNRTFEQATAEILTGTAANATRFNGKTEQEILDEVEAASGGSLTGLQRVFPEYVSSTEGATESWTLLNVFTTGEPAPGSMKEDIRVLVNAASLMADDHDSLYLVTVSTRGDTFLLEVDAIRQGSTACDFCVSFDSESGLQQLWIKTSNIRPPIRITTLGGGSINAIADEDAVVDVEPNTPTYVLADNNQYFIRSAEFQDLVTTMTDTFNSLNS